MKRHQFKVERIDKETIIFDGVKVKAFYTGNRIAFKIPGRDLIVKFDGDREKATWEGDLECQCSREYKRWKRLSKSEWKESFVPILQKGICNGYHYVVMPKVPTLKEQGITDVPRWALMEVHILSKVTKTGDLHDENYTILDEGTPNHRVVIFDYALERH